MDQELKDYLDGRFGQFAGRFDELQRGIAETRTVLRGEITGVRDELRGEITGVRDELQGEITGVRDELRGEIVGLRDENHQTRILVEKLNDKIDLVAEGVQNTNERLDRLMEESRREHEETRKVFGSAIRHLERRVTRHDDEIGQLNGRVGLLEAATEA